MCPDVQPNHMIPSNYQMAFQKPYKDVYIDEDSRTLLVVWNQYSDSVTNEIYAEDCFQILEWVTQRRVKNLISIISMNGYVIPPELQKWYAQEIAIKLEKAGLMKCAIIMENNLTMISSLEEVVNNVEYIKGGPTIDTRFFPDLATAHQWILR